MGEIVDDGDARRRPYRFEPAPQPLEAAKRGGRIRNSDTERSRGGDGGQRVGGVMAAGYL